MADSPTRCNARPQSRSSTASRRSGFTYGQVQAAGPIRLHGRRRSRRSTGADAEYRRPEGHGDTPNDVVAELCSLLGPEVRKTYTKARCAKSKRGPKITFGESINGQDPSVDLVVALTRREGDGLWIPNLGYGALGGLRTPSSTSRCSPAERSSAAPYPAPRRPADEGVEQAVERSSVLLVPPLGDGA